MKVLTLYNHKGGVSKTTTTFNLAKFLAANGKKILIVDADPQCNMTEFCLSNLIAEMDAEFEKTGEMKELPGSSLLEILKPRVDGDVPEIQLSSVNVVNISDGIDLIRGSVDLNTIEDSIAEAHNQRFSTKTHEKRTYVAIGDFLSRLGESVGYDYIFIDVGPSSGPLTRACFLACDGFFVPVAPDRFNIQAIGTLSTIIPRWMSEHNQIYQDFKSLGLPIRRGKPVFLGVIAQHFKLHRGKPKTAYKIWIDRMPQAVNQYLLPVLKKLSDSDHDLTSGLNQENFIVAQIPDFGSLAPCAQEYGKAVFEIQQEDTAVVDPTGRPWQGVAWTDAQKRIESYRTCFADIATRLETFI